MTHGLASRTWRSRSRPHPAPAQLQGLAQAAWLLWASVSTPGHWDNNCTSSGGAPQNQHKKMKATVLRKQWSGMWVWHTAPEEEVECRRRFRLASGSHPRVISLSEDPSPGLQTPWSAQLGEICWQCLAGGGMLLTSLQLSTPSQWRIILPKMSAVLGNWPRRKMATHGDLDRKPLRIQRGFFFPPCSLFFPY